MAGMLEGLQRLRREKRFSGHAIAPGIAIGPVFQAVEPALEVRHRKIAAADSAAELARLEEAIAASRKQLTKLKQKLAALPDQGQAEILPLLDAYLHMLGNSRLIRGARARISDRLVNAESAMIAEAEAQADAILAVTDKDKGARLRRAEEVREIARRVVRNLTRLPFRSFTNRPAGAILVAESLRPSDVALIQPSGFAGVITAEDGPEGHTAVMLRALGLPAVLGARGILKAAKPDVTAIVNGETGEIILNPAAGSLATARDALASRARLQHSLAALQRLPSETTDSIPVTLQANLELPFELPVILEAGAQGIGLMRSEFIFMNREAPPDEDAQTEIYRTVVEAMHGEPVTIRVLDWGSDKDVEALADYVPRSEPNPALGIRGIRLLLQSPELLETQLAAILRASVGAEVRILLPMVDFSAELIAAREIYDRVWRRLSRRHARLPRAKPAMGAMIETPAAALAARQLAKHADFFSIGTNDLTMYTLAADRSLPANSKLYDPFHPVVLRLISETALAAAAANIPVSVCGELAGRPEAAPLLIGLGIRDLSMQGNAIPRVKQVVRRVSLAACTALARAALDAEDAVQVRRMLHDLETRAG